MQRVKLALYSAGVAGLKDICQILDIAVDPVIAYREYSEIVGADLNGAQIEAGLPSVTWSWEAMSQTDFARLLSYVSNGMSAYVYLRTPKNSGESGLDASNYLAVMKRPTFSERVGLIVHGVVVEFVALVVQ